MTNEKNEQAVEETVEVSKAKNTKTAAASSHDDFDWGADEAGFESYSNDERKRLEDAYNSTFQPVVEKQVVKGVVVGMNEKDVVVNIGFKSDGLVPRTEFRDVPNLALGDEVEVFVDIAEDKMGQLILSRKKHCKKRLGKNRGSTQQRYHRYRLCAFKNQRWFGCGCIQFRYVPSWLSNRYQTCS